jgi:D-alanyl-D-alanine carboxypeptidase/D-alanyl-D-alanine-endopeptidase (penicillin-binding protein 4)
VEKLYTTSTALLRFGTSATFDTQVVSTAVPTPDGVLRGDLYLRGGGDPTLTSARMDALAAQLAALGVFSIHGAVVGDESLFDRLRGSYDTGYRLDREIGVLSGLAVDRGWQGRSFQPDPARYAARKLVSALARAGIRVLDGTRTGTAPAAGTPLAITRSAPMAQIAAWTNQPSDNFYAETLLKDLGARFGAGGTTAAGTTVVRSQMARFGIAPRVVDGSGLSRTDHTTPRQVVTLLSRVDGTAAGPALHASLPVPGRRGGTLDTRMRGTAAARRCAAKTGSLIGVSALAGYCTSADGHTIAFAFLMNAISVDRARLIQDRMTIALAGATAGAP